MCGCVCVCVCMFACICVHKKRRLGTQGPESPWAMCSVSPRVYQLIKGTSAPIKGPIKKQGGEAHLDGGKTLQWIPEPAEFRA